MQQETSILGTIVVGLVFFLYCATITTLIVLTFVFLWCWGAWAVGEIDSWEMFIDWMKTGAKVGTPIAVTLAFIVCLMAWMSEGNE